jgi:hypothetical protein
MASACKVCGGQIFLLDRIFGRTVCRRCRSDARLHYRDLLAAIANGRADPGLAKNRLIVLASNAGLSQKRRQHLNVKAFGQFLAHLLALHPALSQQDEASARLNEIGEALTIDVSALWQEAPDLFLKYRVALANAGRLTSISNAKILLTKDEVAHLEVGAGLLKEIHHTRRRYSGVSFRIVRGVYYHIGESHPITTSAIEEIDSGFLTVTSNRVVYTGNRQSVEIPYSKLLAVSVFTDAIEFNVANRKNAVSFRLSQDFGHVVAATVNAAFQHH